MRTMKAKIISALAVILLGVPLVLCWWLSSKDKRYDELVSMVECYPFPCTADFNQNGTLDRLEIVQDNPDDRLSWRLVITDDGRRLFELPYESTDNSFRTRAAIRRDGDVPRLLVYDGVSLEYVKGAFEWSGEEMSEIKTSPLDREILNAMAARDDSGSRQSWIIYQLLLYFALPVYLLFVGGFLVLFSKSKFLNGKPELR